MLRSAVLAPASGRLPVRALAVVLGGAGGVLAGWSSSGPAETVALGALSAALALASVIDVQERRIPNRLTYPGAAVALAVSVLAGSGLASVAGLAAAGGFMLLAAAIGRGRLGMGDVKLSAFAGAALGIQGVPLFLVAGTLAGALAGAGLLLAGRGRDATLPYGPALAVGAVLAAVVEGVTVS